MSEKSKIDIIVVDDDPSELEYQEAILCERNISFEMFSDPQIALKEIAKKLPKLVMMDFHMPQMTGQELIIKISEHKLFHHSTIYLLTSKFIDDDERTRLRSLGFMDIFNKPIDQDRYLSIVDKVIPSK